MKVTAGMGILIEDDDDVADDENGNADYVHADFINMKVEVTADMGISIENADVDGDENGNADDVLSI